MTGRTKKHEDARESLPEDSRIAFDCFVEDYRFCATKHNGFPFVSYVVVAEMIRHGWRIPKE